MRETAVGLLERAAVDRTPLYLSSAARKPRDRNAPRPAIIDQLRGENRRGARCDPTASMPASSQGQEAGHAGRYARLARCTAGQPPCSAIATACRRCQPPLAGSAGFSGGKLLGRRAYQGPVLSPRPGRCILPTSRSPRPRCRPRSDRGDQRLRRPAHRRYAAPRTQFVAGSSAAVDWQGLGEPQPQTPRQRITARVHSTHAPGKPIIPT